MFLVLFDTTKQFVNLFSSRLVVWNMFFHILGIVTPTDYYFFREVETTNQVVTITSVLVFLFLSETIVRICVMLMYQLISPSQASS
jgi:hypothetical protein